MKIVDKVAGRMRRASCERQLKKLRDVSEPEVILIGSGHGKWIMTKNAIKAGAVAVCVGAGEDVSFDVELNKQGMRVYCLDPTPRAKKHVEGMMAAAAAGKPYMTNYDPPQPYDFSKFDATRFTFKDWGVWNENTTMRFFAPKDENHVSHSIVNLQKTEKFFEAQCLTLRTICEKLKIDKIDILKLDVEGAEFTILKDLLANGPLPPVLGVEFDEIRSPLDDKFMDRITDTVNQLKQAGYKLREIDESNTLFIK